MRKRITGISRKCGVCGKMRYATREAAQMKLAKLHLKDRERSAYLAHGWWHLTKIGGQQ